MKKLFQLMIAFGIILIFGTAGGSDMDTLSVAESLHQAGMAILIIAVGYLGLRSTVKVKKVPVKRRMRYIRNYDLPYAA